MSSNTTSWPKAQIPDAGAFTWDPAQQDGNHHKSIPGCFNCVDSTDPSEIIHVTRMSTGDDDGPHCKWNDVTTNVLNARPLENITLDATGFELIDSEMPNDFDFLDSLNVIENYYPRCEELLEKHLSESNNRKEKEKPKKVMVKAFDHNVRMGQSTSSTDKDRRLKNGGGSTIQHPIAVVHGDYTHISAPRRVELLGEPPKVNDVLRLKLSKDQSLLPTNIVQDLLMDKKRYALINVWRNIDPHNAVSSFPLACCDARTVRKDDLRTLQIHYVDRIGENYLMVHEERHKWMYFPFMHYNEVMMIKQWDSAGSFARSKMNNCDGDYVSSTFAIHSAFQTPMLPNMTPRKSIEVHRPFHHDGPLVSLAFFGKKAPKKKEYYTYIDKSIQDSSQSIGPMWTSFTRIAASFIFAVSAMALEGDQIVLQGNESFHLSSSALNKLMSTATLTNPNRELVYNQYQYNNYNDDDSQQTSRISRYSIQFQGCHNIRQWNNNADEEDVRIYSKRLARFRLVPYEKCSSYNPWMDSGALKNLFGSVDYGEYIVDMDSFVQAYLEMKLEASGNNYYFTNNGFDLSQYSQCAAFDFNAGDGYQYYVGPFCADQGGEIRLSLFTDDTCTTQATCNSGKSRGASCYKLSTGSVLPYSDQSIIQDPCVPCSSTYSYLSTVPVHKLDISTYDFSAPRDACYTIYGLSGKCEKNMKMGEYNYGCTYMSSIQVGMSSDGFAVVVKRSLTADVFLALLVIAVTFLAMYIYYLRYILRKVTNDIYYTSDIPSFLS